MQRFAENPLIRPEDVEPSHPDYEVVGAFNAGVARYGDELILLLRVAERPREQDPQWVIAPVWDSESGAVSLLRVRRDDPDLLAEDARVFRYRGDFHLTTISHIRTARSRDGGRFSIGKRPALFPADRTESFGIEDPRVTSMGGDYWITYKAVSGHGIATALARTRDFRSFTRYGLIFCPENMDVVIFPEQFEGRYVAWTRPVGMHLGPPAVWTARSPDLIHWGEHAPTLAPRPGRWDSARVGAGTTPFRTRRGWLSLYHGADERDRYCAGLILSDAADPGRIIARSSEPILQPEAPCEIDGFFANVVFPCGADVREDGAVVVYYGAADRYTCGAATTVEALLASLPN